MDGPDGPDSSQPSRNCTVCGSRLEPAANFCSACGAAISRSDLNARSGVGVGDTGTARSTDGADEVTDRDVLEYRIASATEAGWKLEGDYGDYAVMVRRTVGDLTTHVLIAILTIWFTGGLANLLYGGYKYFGDAERIVLRPDQRRQGPSRQGTRERADPGRNALGWFVGIACLVLAGLFALFGVLSGVFSIVLIIFVVLLATFGLLALPPILVRVRRRHSISKNGRVRTVDERAVSAPDEPCTSCSSPVDSGVERTYRESFCLLGFPLTTAEGRNYYCRDCANAEGVSDGVVESGGNVSVAETGDRTTDDEGAGDPAEDRDRSTNSESKNDLEPEST